MYLCMYGYMMSSQKTSRILKNSSPILAESLIAELELAAFRVEIEKVSIVFKFSCGIYYL